VSGSQSVPFVAVLHPMKRQYSSAKHQELLSQHGVTSHRIGSFIHTAMRISNLASLPILGNI